MSEQNKEKISFVDLKEQRLTELAKNRAKSGAPQPPKKERTLFDVYDETNRLLGRIVDALEGKVRAEEDLKKSPSEELKTKPPLNLKKIPEVKSEKLKVDANPNPPEPKSVYVDEVRQAFLQEVNDVFDIKEEGDYVTIRGRGYVGTEVYSKVEKTVLIDFGGEKVAGEKVEGRWKSYPYLRIHKRNF